MLIPSIENTPCIYVNIVIHPINQNKPPVWDPFGRYTIVCKLFRISTDTYKLLTHENILQLDVKMTTTNGNQHIKWVYLFLTNVNLCMKCVIRVFMSTFVYFSKFCNVFFVFFVFLMKLVKLDNKLTSDNVNFRMKYKSSWTTNWSMLVY